MLWPIFDVWRKDVIWGMIFLSVLQLLHASNGSGDMGCWLKSAPPRATADFSCCSGQVLQCSLLWARQDKQALVAELFLKAHLMLSTCCLGRVTKRSLSSLSYSFCDLCPFGSKPGYSTDFLGWWLPSTSQRSVTHDHFITAFGRVKTTEWKKKTHWQAKNFKVSLCWVSNIRK